MKLLIIIACIFVVTNGQQDKLKETVLQFHLFFDVHQYTHSITPESDAGKCLAACVNKKINLQDPNGQINPDGTREAAKIIKGLDEKWYNKLLEITEKCINEVRDDSDECDTGAHWFTCMNKGQREAGLPLILSD